MSRAFTTVGDGTSKCQFRLHLLRKGVDDDFVGIDNSFLDEGVVYSLADKEQRTSKTRQEWRSNKKS